MISNTGKVFSRKASKYGKILKEKRHHSGYLMVSLSLNGKVFNRYIHRLVATEFLEKKEGKTTVNHIDGNKHNNNVDNLEWATPSENIKHSFDVLGKKSPMFGKKGASNKNSKTVYQISKNGLVIKKWDCVSDAARFLNCNPSQIINVIAGRGKTCKGYFWSYDI